MKAPLIKINHLTINILEAEAPTASASLLEPGTVTAATPAGDALNPPALGEYWPGQDGIYAGVRQYPEGLCHVIFAATDAGKHAYGEYGTEVEAISRHDGRENTAVLVSRDGSHPAADAAYAFTCDGHSDFYLPSIGELNHAWQYIPESFDGGWYISSTQRSAYGAYSMDFEDGWLYLYGKTSERLARPVRRFLQ